MARFEENGAAELYYDGTKKLETISGGISVTGGVNTTAASSFSGAIHFGDSVKANFGAGDDFKIFHNGSNSYIDAPGTVYLYIRPESEFLVQDYTSGEVRIKASNDGAVELYYDGVKKFETAANGVLASGYIDIENGHLYLRDSYKAQFGASQDLQIYHGSGGDSYIQDKGSGNLYITGDDIIIQNNDTSENIAKFIENSYVSFYFDNSQKFYTQSYGCVCAGDLKPESNNTHNLGDSSYRWANLYVNDMHFSNEGKSNSVDGTWGDWTLQEGDENIFMINNRTGKKYKMGLVEIS